MNEKIKNVKTPGRPHCDARTVKVRERRGRKVGCW